VEHRAPAELSDNPGGRIRHNALLRLFGFPHNSSRRDLQQLGITKSWTSNVPVLILVGLLLAVTAVIAGAAATDRLNSELVVSAATAMITVAGLLVAVLQWRAGLAEKALDAVYGRIDLANRMLLKATQGLETSDDFEIARKRPDDYRFFVFTEIDSLEYAVMRYRFGLGMTDVIADRVVSHFRRRCVDSAKFREAAHSCASAGAYFESTKGIVMNILDASHAEHASQIIPERLPSTRD
jgi:hypothetical protein